MRTVLLVALFVLAAVVSFSLVADAQAVDCVNVTQTPIVKLVGNRGHICPSETGTVTYSAVWNTGSSAAVTVPSQKNVAIPVFFEGACGEGLVHLSQTDEALDTSEVAVVTANFRPCPPVLVP